MTGTGGDAGLLPVPGTRERARLFPRLWIERDGAVERFKLNPFQKRVVEALRRSRIVCSFAGNRTGKTLLGAHTHVASAVNARDGEIFWACCESTKQQREVNQPAILAALAPHEIRRRRGRPMIWETRGIVDRIVLTGPRGGGTIQFRNYKDGATAFAGPGVREIWADELVGARDGDVRIAKEMRARVVNTGGTILLTLTAVEGLTETLRYFMDLDETEVVHGSTWENAENLPPGEIEQFEATLDEWEREVRIGGRVLPLGGRPYVPGDVLVRMRGATTPPARVEEWERAA